MFVIFFIKNITNIILYFGTVDLGYSTRYLIEFCDEYNNYDILTILLRKYNTSTWDVYHYSITWNYPKVFDKLIEDFNDIIDFSHTCSAIDMARRFNNNDIVNHVIYKIKTHLPEIYEKLPEKLKNIKINSNDI
jgi:hypothetical protein